MLKRDDQTELEGLGRVWALSITLPASPENQERIQEGPDALKLAGDYYQIAKDDKERFDVVAAFHEGMRYFTPYHGMYQLEQMFDTIKAGRERDI